MFVIVAKPREDLKSFNLTVNVNGNMIVEELTSNAPVKLQFGDTECWEVVSILSEGNISAAYNAEVQYFRVYYKYAVFFGAGCATKALPMINTLTSISEDLSKAHRLSPARCMIHVPHNALGMRCSEFLLNAVRLEFFVSFCVGSGENVFLRGMNCHTSAITAILSTSAL